ncbi:MAG: NAD(P)-dependent oxidoreductase [Clostridium sp.]|nr:NAD(P)-dependent oxidoreductase [Clostridium sp.]
MKILVTGGSGFVGRNVKEYLTQRGYDIYAPASTELDCINENKVKEHLQTHYYDVVLHFAVCGDKSDCSKDGSKILEYNLRIFSNFAKYSDLYGRMIYTGSGAEYDKRYPIQMVTEPELQTRTLPVDQYGLMKYIATQQIESSNNIYNLRLFGIFGKYEDWKIKYISNLCCKSLKGLPLSLRQNCYFDYLWIDDFCHMLEKFLRLDKPQYHVYNAVRGEKIDLLSLAHIVNEVADDKREIFICREGYANEYTANNARIMKEIPDIVYTDIKDSVSQLYEWYKAHQNEIDTYSLIYG